MSRRGLLATVCSVGLLILAVCRLAPARAAAEAPRRGTVHFEPDAQEPTSVPAPFQLASHAFAYEAKRQPSLSDEIELWQITFPSPVKTASERNNTVHCEYYRPAAPGKYPACVVLHILGGDFPLSRVFASTLAHRGVAALFVIMPYYGPRRDPESKLRMVSSDPQQTVRGMTQAIKDIRYAAAWLAAQPEVDSEQLGIFGISLGGITASLAAEAEPRFHKVCPVLAGGGIGTILWESNEPHLAEARQKWLAGGGTRESLLELMATIDPANHGDLARNRKILMLNADHDEVIPKPCTEALSRAPRQAKNRVVPCRPLFGRLVFASSARYRDGLLFPRDAKAERNRRWSSPAR